MSGAMRRIGEYLGLLEDTGRYDDEYDEFETQETAPVAQARVAKRESRPAPVSDLSERRRPASGPTGVVAELSPSRPCTHAPTTRRVPSARTSARECR
jgi:cell division inhibitor SepF